jgi:hypothetical protein
MVVKKPVAPKIKESKVEAPAPVTFPLIRSANARKTLDETIKAKILEALSKPGANMTKIAADTSVSYGTVLGIKQKLAGPKPAARQLAKTPAKSDDPELMRLELEFLRRKVALLETRIK